ncbi:MAG: tripartite tricarboxylate transporter TctB family protein [Pyramidobacter sp.]|nr:tripartite tricarboxylate transporter TctB family protein [Pyramidobacter sp.]
MKKNDTTLYLCIFLFCAAMVPTIYGFVEGSEGYEVSPLFWPLMAAYLGVAFAAIAFFAGLKDGQKFAPAEIFSGIWANRSQIAFVAMGNVYVLAMDYVGFLVASLVMLPVLLLYFGYRKYVTGLVISTAFVTAVFLIFSKVFKIHFPTWTLGGF